MSDSRQGAELDLDAARLDPLHRVPTDAGLFGELVLIEIAVRPEPLHAASGSVAIG